MAQDTYQEIMALATALSRPLPADWPDFLTRFAGALGEYREYQVSLHSGEVGLITLGRESSFVEAVEQYLQALGIAPESIATFQNMSRFAGRATWGLKLALVEPAEVQVYVKKPLPLVEVLFWLEQRQVIAPATAEVIRRVAAVLNKDHTHFVGADFTPGRAPRFQIYFTQYLQEMAESGRRVVELLPLLGLPSAQGFFERHYPLLARPAHTVWLSFGFDRGAVLPSLKLDFSGVRFGVVDMVLAELGRLQPERDYLDGVGRALGVDSASYLGLRLYEQQPATFSLYLTRPADKAAPR
jgi:hypothetical protein